MSVIRDPETYKTIIVGSSGVGKTSMTNRLVNDAFEEFEPTIGVIYKSYRFSSNDVDIRLHLWDTSGQERFRGISKAYFRNSLGAVLVFSLTDRESFNDLKMWFDSIEQLCAPNVYIILVGCKSDDESNRLISNAEAQQFANRYGIEYFEASSKTGFNVNTIFKTLGEGIFRRINDGQINMKEENENKHEDNKEDDKEVEEEEDEDEDEFVLDPKNLSNFPFELYEKDFTFILNGRQYQTSRIVADILSPTIRNMHHSDPTIDEFVINTDSIDDSLSENEGENYFLNFLNLCSFRPASIDEKSRMFYLRYFFLLGNMDEYLRLLPKYNGKNVDKAFDRLQNYIELFNRNSQLIINDDKLFDFIASHFYQVDQERLMNLPLSVIEKIVFNENLVVEDEDSLLCFIYQLYEKDSSFSTLFGAVHFINVSKSVLEEFLDNFRIDDLDITIWKSISYRLIHFGDEDKDNSTNDKRYHKKK